jgi:hypothetical protein
MHDLNDNLQKTINMMSDNGWTMFKAFNPEYYKDSKEDQFIRIIWQKDSKKIFDEEIEVMNLNNTIEFIKNKSEELKSTHKTSEKSHSKTHNPYFLTDGEYNKMKELGSNTVKISSNSGIGMGISCLDKNGEWIDITNYDNW